MSLTETINQRIDQEGSVNETVCPGCNHDAAIRPLAADGTCRWQVGEDEIGPKYCGHACKRVCVKHCEHDPDFMFLGSCGATAIIADDGFPIPCGHLCTFSEPCKDCGETFLHTETCTFGNFNVPAIVKGEHRQANLVEESERVLELPERHEFVQYQWGDSGCWFGDAGGNRCGQPKGAAVHGGKKRI